MGPVAIVYPDATFYRRLKAKDAEAIVEEHILKESRTAVVVQNTRREGAHPVCP